MSRNVTTPPDFTEPDFANEADVDKWKRELTEAGWTAESATAWRSTNGGLYRGPYGAWIQLQRQKGMADV